ncbi:hypothetical protein OJF2_34000 [Aquisphaera giovannonii]|uniref:Uncharacterized protein n=1 Tax=Aquisphaera giovannonii TaxID=406548 RepID=A0A5B9W431_9BACT|nr:hypothetical protein [Aquisphaera giovannonii]QEH34855.1 hypothetical protein OJF2_34000 [Aquisphaera giovannonii]
MIKPRRRFQAGLESLEGKALLSAVPAVTPSTLNSVLKQIDRAAGTFAKTHNPAIFDAALSSISRKVPYGHDQLFPTWQDTEALYDPGTPGSGLAMVRQLKADLKDYVQSAVADGSIRMKGAWAGISNVASAASTTSGFAPILTSKTYVATLKQIDRAAGTFAKTHNAAAFDAALSGISRKVPYGHDQLFPTWQDTETLYDPGTPGSGVAMVRQLKADLKDYVQAAVAEGSIRVR